MVVIHKPAPFDIPPEVRIARAQHRAKLERIKYIPLHKLMADACNPEKAYKHHRIIAEFGRRFIAFGRKYQLKSGRIVSCTLARNDGYFRTAEYAVDLPLDAIDWHKMYEALKIWEADRIATLNTSTDAVKAELTKEFEKLSLEEFSALTAAEIKAIKDRVKKRIYMREYEARTHYYKNHYKNNPSMRADTRERDRKYNAARSEKRREYERRYREAHREELAERERIRYAAKKLAKEANQ